jgi:hypothetical protein
MHRSGTSAVTRALAALGLDPGVDPLMAATEDNPTGHFEVGRLNGLDDELLDALGGRWSAPPEVEPVDVAALAATSMGERARLLTAEVFADPAWVWKDPRVMLLLPFWRAVLSPEPVAVVVLRHPLEVARSLRARDGMALDYGLALWERYTRVALRDLEGMTAFVLDYGAAMADPGRALTDLDGFLVACELSAGNSGVGSQDAFVSDHHRQRVTDEEFAAEPAVTDEVRALHRLVGGLHGSHAAFPKVDLGSETPGLQRAFTEHKRLSRSEERASVLAADVALLESRTADLRAEIERRSEQAGEMASEVMALRAEHASLTERLVELESWWPVLTAMRARRVLRGLTRRS